MGLLVGGVSLGAAAVWFVVNSPDNREATLLRDALLEKARPVSAFAPDGWDHVCLGPEGVDLRAHFGPMTGRTHAACSGWNGGFSFYAGYASIGFNNQQGCHVIPVLTDIMRLDVDETPVCYDRKGLLYFNATSEQVPLLSIVRE